MPLRDLLDALHRDTVKRWWQWSIGAGIALSLLAIGSWIDGTNHRAEVVPDVTKWRCYVLTEGADHIDVVRVAPNVTWPHEGRIVNCP